MNNTPIYFTFPALSGKYSIGVQVGEWTFIYKNNPGEEIILQEENYLFPLYGKNLSFFEGYTEISFQVTGKIRTLPRIFEMQYNPEEYIFYGLYEQQRLQLDGAQVIEQLDIVFSSQIRFQELQTRIFEMELGCITTLEHNIERYYHGYIQASPPFNNESDSHFSTRERKKMFESLFQNEILPLCRSFGFEKMTPNGHSLIREGDDTLIQVLSFSYIGFGSGAYSMNVSWYHPEVGSPQDDMYLATIQRIFPYTSNMHIHCNNEKMLLLEIQYCKRNLQYYLLPFLDQCRSKKDIEKHIESRKIYEMYYNTTHKPEYSLNFSSRGKTWLKNL